MKRSIFALLLSFITLGALSPAGAAPEDEPKERGWKYGASCFPAYAVQKKVTAANTLTTIATCIPFDAQIRVSIRGGAGGCILTMAPDGITVGAFSGDTGFTITDARPGTGPASTSGSGFSLPASGSEDWIPVSYDALRYSAGQREALCSTGVRLHPSLSLRYPPCRSGDTCPSGSCSTPSGATVAEHGCARLACQVDTADAFVGLEVCK